MRRQQYSSGKAHYFKESKMNYALILINTEIGVCTLIVGIYVFD